MAQIGGDLATLKIRPDNVTHMRRIRLPDDHRDRLLTLGVASIGIGFAMIGLAWNGAAGKDTIQEQFPYILSGGIGGLGLLLVGACLIVLQAFRRDHDRVCAELAWLRESITAQAGTASAAPEKLAAGEQPVSDQLVVAGRSSYHRRGCNLVKGRDAHLVALPAARALGLSACRICVPD